MQSATNDGAAQCNAASNRSEAKRVNNAHIRYIRGDAVDERTLWSIMRRDAWPLECTHTHDRILLLLDRVTNARASTEIIAYYIRRLTHVTLVFVCVSVLLLYERATRRTRDESWQRDIG